MRVILLALIFMLAIGSIVPTQYDQKTALTSVVTGEQAEQTEQEPLKPLNGQPVFIRIFKQESQLELWAKMPGNETYSLHKTYDICAWSGHLGPKLKEGDGQSPEGFYAVSKGQLNPNSSYHLSFNIGFPNVFDKQNHRSGSFLMVHGNCVSIGCYAMTDEGIDEIYGAVEDSLNAENGQDAVAIHIFPFRMTSENMAKNEDNKWLPFWKNLAEGYALFERTHVPPKAYACNGTYAFKDAKDCKAVTSWSGI